MLACSSQTVSFSCLCVLLIALDGYGINTDLILGQFMQG